MRTPNVRGRGQSGHLRTTGGGGKILRTSVMDGPLYNSAYSCSWGPVTPGPGSVILRSLNTRSSMNSSLGRSWEDASFTGSSVWSASSRLWRATLETPPYEKTSTSCSTSTLSLSQPLDAGRCWNKYSGTSLQFSIQSSDHGNRVDQEYNIPCADVECLQLHPGQRPDDE